MAFLQDNKYIKLFENGSFKVYSSEAKRLKHKNATSSEVILAKYRELESELDAQVVQLITAAGYPESAMSDPDLYDTLISLPGAQELAEKLGEFNTEFSQYNSDLANEQGTQHEFPIMAQIYPDVKDSIPEIIEGANIGIWKATTLADMYEEAKAKHRFGETEDC